jgi:hypothetical protein
MIEISGIKFEFVENGDVKITNNTNERSYLRLIDPNNGYVGFDAPYFNKGVWIQTVMSIWPNQPNKFNAVVTGKTGKKQFVVDIKNKNVIDVTLLKSVIDYKVETHKISIIISTYKSANYLDQIIDIFKKQVDRYSDIEIEILVGIDSCFETLEHISEKNYPDYVKFYFTNENVGTYFIRNSLSIKAKHETLLFFDSDDIPNDDMLFQIFTNIKDNDVLRYKFIEYNEITGLKSYVSKVYSFGTFVISKRLFYEINGFYTWRVSSDFEFALRIDSKGCKVGKINEPIFMYRKGLINQLTSKFGGKTNIRKIYNNIVCKRRTDNFFPNPERLKYIEMIRIF